MKSLKDNLTGLSKNKLIRATVLEVLGNRCTVRLVGNGKKLFGIPFIGGPVSVGKIVYVNYGSGSPVAECRGETTTFQASAPRSQRPVVRTEFPQSQIGGANNEGTVAIHATTHASGGADALKLDDLAAPDDNTDLNATTGAHGLLPKLGGGTTNFLRADGTWASPASSGDAADVTYTPAVLTDWNSDADPGDVDNALDQLAARIDDAEAMTLNGLSDVTIDTPADLELLTYQSSGGIWINRTALEAALVVNNAANTITLRDAATNAVSDMITLIHNTSGTPAANYGSGIVFKLESSTTESQHAAGIQAFWKDATHATRKGALAFYVADQSYIANYPAIILEATADAVPKVHLGTYGFSTSFRLGVATGTLTHSSGNKYAIYTEGSHNVQAGGSGNFYAIGGYAVVSGSNTPSGGTWAGLAFSTLITKTAGDLGTSCNPSAINVSTYLSHASYAGTIAYLRGIYIAAPWGISASAAGAVVSNAYGIQIEPATKNAGTITNLYGIYIASQTVGASNYAIYTGAGVVRFGDRLSIVGSQDAVQLNVQKNGTQTNAVAKIGDPTGGNYISVADNGNLSFVGTATLQVKLDDLLATDDNTDLDASAAKHGLLPKLGGGTTNFLRADGTWSAPPAGGVVDAGDVTYTPSVATDWDSDTDPGDVDNALNQLAERVDDLEGASPGGGSSVLEIQVFS